MNLSERISSVINHRSQELYFLLRFVKDCDAYIQERQNRSISNIAPDMPDNLKTEFMEYFGEFRDFVEEVGKEIEGTASAKGKKTWNFKPQKKYPTEVTKYLFPQLISLLRPIRYPQFLYNMAVTHTIAFFESFLKDFLISIFTLRPKTLKSGNMATYEEILSFSSRKKLIGHLASNRADKILEGDLYANVSDKLNKTFSIDISKFDKFNIIHEAFCRRHIIVHNDGVTDKDYCEKYSTQKEVRGSQQI
jgi:hypothetical protein